MNHRIWKMEICYSTPLTELRNEHNALYADWKQSSLEVERLAKVNGDLCDKIAELKSRPVLTWEECGKEWVLLRCSMEDGVPIQNRKFLAWLQSRLPAPIRVPLSDAAIEKMAAAAFVARYGIADNWELQSSAPTTKAMWCDMIRAALAAGGIEPCAVPEDVAFVPERASDDELEHVYEQGREFGELVNLDGIRAVRARVEAPLLAEIRHLRGKLASAHQKTERQAAELTKLYHLRQVDAGERRGLESDCAWNKQAADSLRAQLEAVTAELAALRQPVDSTPTDAQVEALARVLDTAYEIEAGGHTMWRDQSPYHQDRRCAQARAAYAHIGRGPVGWEFDVTAEEYAAWKLQQFGYGNSVVTARESLDWLRSRIKPTYECKECAEGEDSWRTVSAAVDRIQAAVNAARAALEGE